MRRRGRRNPTSELDLHLRIVTSRPAVGAVVHAHPPAATGFAVAGQEIPANLLPELIFLVGRVPIVPYGTPGTMGSTLDQAWIRMETLHNAAPLVLRAQARREKDA